MIITNNITNKAFKNNSPDSLTLNKLFAAAFCNISKTAISQNKNKAPIAVLNKITAAAILA